MGERIVTITVASIPTKCNGIYINWVYGNIFAYHISGHEQNVLEIGLI